MIAPQQVKIDELRRLAEEGDAEAQYALAGFLSGSAPREEVDRWLNAAAALGHGDALYTLATRCFETQERAEEAAELLTRASAAGSHAAQRLLGILYADGLGVPQNWETAVSHVIAAAREGAPPAMRELAMLLFAVDPDDADGAALIANAAKRDPVAAAVAVRRAAMNRKYADANLASIALRHLAEGRYPNAGALSAALQARQPDSAPSDSEPATEPDWDRIASQLSNGPPAPAIEPQAVCTEPSARVFRDAFTPEECEYVIASSVRKLAPSLIVDPQTGQSRQDEYRTSLTAVLSPVDLDLALVKMNRRMAALAGCPQDTGEFLGILCYRPGQEYRAHYDWLPPGPELDRSGQRVTTALIYLNEDYEGGETHFLTPDIRFKGAAGDLLVFDNVSAGGAPDQAARHAGRPVMGGYKWLGSRWFREKNYTY